MSEKKEKKKTREIRSNVIPVRATDSELRQIDKIAKSQGLNRSEYIRRKIQSDVDVQATHPENEELVSTLKNLYSELYPIGNNLNQLTRGVNTLIASGLSVPECIGDPEDLEELRNQVWNTNRMIKGLILEVKPKKPRKRNKSN